MLSLGLFVTVTGVKSGSIRAGATVRQGAVATCRNSYIMWLSNTRFFGFTCLTVKTVCQR